MNTSAHKPFSSIQINRARAVPLRAVLDALDCYVKQDAEFKPRSPNSVRLEVNCRGRHFRFVLTGEKWLNELIDRDAPKRGGGGALDFYQHLTGEKFIDAVSACLEIAAKSIVSEPA